MANNWIPVTYDPASRQLSTIPDSFASRDLSVLAIVWKSGIDVGASVAPGTELAVIQWEDNSRKTFKAPENCTGEITSVNRNIMFADLAFEPAVWLLILSQD